MSLPTLPAAVPRRTVVFSSGNSYYDAAASTSESSYGNFLSVCSEDFYFSGAQRWIVLGRLRREIRNNPYLSGLYNKFPESIGQSTLRSRTKDKAYNDKKDRFWFQYSRAVTNTGDSMRSTENILERELLVAGEIFYIKLANGRVQPIPSEYCGSIDSRAVPYGDGGREVNGIIYNEAGEVSHYRFGTQGAAGGIGFRESSVVPAEFVIHVFEKDRVHMGRGLPALLPSLRPAHDLYEITRAKTKQIKDVSSIFGTIEKQGAGKFLAGLGGLTDDNGEPKAEPGSAPADPEADSTRKAPVRIELKPGTFIGLEPGEKLNKLTSDYQAGDYKELVMLMLHAIASPIGLPVELWFSGLGDVNYSGFKGLGTQWNARRRYLHSFIEERFLDPLYSWRITKAQAEGDLPPNPEGDDDLIDWRWRRTAILDEEKEGKANEIKLRSGEISHADIWEEKGFYAEEVFAARRETWIKLQIASGVLKEGQDHSAVIVPIEFLLRNELPGDKLSIAAPTPRPAPPTDPVKDPANDEDDEDAPTPSDAEARATVERLLAEILKLRASLSADPSRN